MKYIVMCGDLPVAVCNSIADAEEYIFDKAYDYARNAYCGSNMIGTWLVNEAKRKNVNFIPFFADYLTTDYWVCEDEVEEY